MQNFFELKSLTSIITDINPSLEIDKNYQNKQYFDSIRLYHYFKRKCDKFIINRFNCDYDISVKPNVPLLQIFYIYTVGLSNILLKDKNHVNIDITLYKFRKYINDLLFYTHYEIDTQWQFIDKSYDI